MRCDVAQTSGFKIVKHVSFVVILTILVVNVLAVPFLKVLVSSNMKSLLIQLLILLIPLCAVGRYHNQA